MHCICLKTILLKLNITIKVIILLGKWFTVETICNSVLQSLLKNCLPRARNPLSHTLNVIILEKKTEAITKMISHWSRVHELIETCRYVVDIVEIKIQHFKHHIGKEQLCDKRIHILSIRKTNSNRIILVTINKRNTASTSYFNFRDRERRLPYLRYSLKRDINNMSTSFLSSLDSKLRRNTK